MPGIAPSLLLSRSSVASGTATTAAAPSPRGATRHVPAAGGARKQRPAPGKPPAAATVTKAAAATVTKAAAATVTKAAAATGAAATPARQRPKLNVAILSEKQLHGGQKLTVLKGDLSTVQADAVVHPTSSSYAVAGQVGRALCSRGGDPMRLAIRALASSAGPLALCAAKECQAHGLGADWVINCHGPNWRTGEAADLIDNLEKTVKNCLALAEARNFASIAMPSIGSGSAGFPKHTAAQTILQTIRAYFAAQMTSSIKQVYFVLYDQESVDVYTSELGKLDG